MISQSDAKTVLPYTDSKDVGAADFYFAINATFRFISDRLGMDYLRQYWRDLGSRYMRPVTELWKHQGLSGVADYWRAFFAAEPGAEVEVLQEREKVVLNVRKCPAIAHLRSHQREIVPCFCQHCYFVSEAMSEPAGLTVRIQGGNGSCRQTFWQRGAVSGGQDLANICQAGLRDDPDSSTPTVRSDPKPFEIPETK
jgi:hypothetical protein